MKIVFAPRAARDLRQIGAYYRAVASERVAVAAAERIRHVIRLIARQPEIAPGLSQRPAVLVLRYPYNRVRQDEIEILHIRHTARRP